MKPSPLTITPQQTPPPSSAAAAAAATTTTPSLAIDLISQVKELHKISSQDLTKWLKDSENFLLFHMTTSGSSIQFDLEKLIRLLPVHLTAVLLSSKRDEASLTYVLSGLRLLNSLCETASHHSKLEQILLDDLKVSEQILDLVLYLLIVCCKQGYSFSGAIPLLYSALVTCSMYLLTTCISSQWNELTYVLQAYPKVDMFVEAAFGAVRNNINFLQVQLSAADNNLQKIFCVNVDEIVNFCCQQCEASLQFLQPLCQNKSFRERLLRNKEVCGKGGVLHLVQATLKLRIPSCFKGSHTLIAAVSRLKARVLSILLHLCEAESVSYLDEVASIPESLDLAKSVAEEVFGLLKNMLNGDPKQLEYQSSKTYKRGLLQLNALRLADIFSDDSNFRSYITLFFAEVLAAILSIPYQQFLSSWCSSDSSLREEDASLEFEPFLLAGWILESSLRVDTTNVKTCEPNLIPMNNAQNAYAHQRTSLLVKVIANLHCFVPKICKEQERNFFLQNFLELLKLDYEDPKAGVPFSSAPQSAATICKNLRLLLGHAESLIPIFLNEEDVQLLRLFFTQLLSLLGPVDSELNRSLELQNPGGSSFLQGYVDPDPKTKHTNLTEGTSENSGFQGVDDSNNRVDTTVKADGPVLDQIIFEDKHITSMAEGLIETEELRNAETTGSDSSSTSGKNPAVQVGHEENAKSNDNFHIRVPEDERVETLKCEEKLVKKRKRSIMNDTQISMVERALQEEPDMHRSPASLQSWADKLSIHGAEVTSVQLKNWLNNRKAKLARAAKDGRPSTEDNSTADKQVGSLVRIATDSRESKAEHIQVPLNGLPNVKLNISQSPIISQPETSSRLNIPNECPTSSCVNFTAGQAVALIDAFGKEIAKGTVFQVEGEWHGCSLADSKTCVVDITELKSKRLVRLPHPSIEAGATFEQAEVKIGAMRVLWDSGKMIKR